MKVRKRRNNLIVTLPILEPFRLSRSGKRLLIATSRGARRTGLKHLGNPVYANVNVYMRPDQPQATKKHRNTKSKPSRRRRSAFIDLNRS